MAFPSCIATAIFLNQVFTARPWAAFSSSFGYSIQCSLCFSLSIFQSLVYSFFLWLAMLNSWPSTFTWLVFRHFSQTHHDAPPLSTGGLHPCIPAAWFGVGGVWWVIWPLVCGTAHRFHFESPTSGPPRFCVTAVAHARPSAVAPPSRNLELYLLQFPATLCFPCVTPATPHFPRVFSCHITLPSRNSCHITLPPCVFLPHCASLA